MVEFAAGRRHRHQPLPGPGVPLDAEVRGVMEPRFGYDFSRVRVHTDPEAGRIGALAYTTGARIGFAPGRYQPGTAEGRLLLAHELAHVVQQSGQRAAIDAPVSSPGEAAEAAGDRAARAFGAAEAPDPVSARAIRSQLRASGSSTPRIMRATAVPDADAGGDQDTVPEDATVPTWAGTIVVSGYRTEPDNTGAMITLSFVPGRQVHGKEIGFVQTASSTVNGKPFMLDGSTTIKDRSIPAGQPGEGTHIDNFTYSTNPFFNLYGPDPGKRLGQAITGGGAEVTNEAPDHLVSNPWMRDAAHLPHHGPGDGQSFESAVVATAGEQQGTYYGSVRWGWRADSGNRVVRLPITKGSNDTPSPTFMRAAGQWSHGSADLGKPQLPLPGTQTKVVRAGGELVAELGNPAAKRWQLAKGTRVELTDRPGVFNEDARNTAEPMRVTVVSGPYAGQVGFVAIGLLTEP